MFLELEADDSHIHGKVECNIRCRLPNALTYLQLVVNLFDIDTHRFNKHVENICIGNWPET